MKIEGYSMPKSSFLSVDKDLGTISRLLIENNRLCKLLYRLTDTPLDEGNLSEEEKSILFDKEYIRVVPRFYISDEVKNYISITFDNFVPSGNPEFRNNVIIIDIICHFSQWKLKSGLLRPYQIAGTIDSMLDGKKMSGIGTLSFVGGSFLPIDREFAGIQLIYGATHGGDDKVGFNNPEEEEKFLNDFVSNWGG